MKKEFTTNNYEHIDPNYWIATEGINFFGEGPGERETRNFCVITNDKPICRKEEHYATTEALIKLLEA